MTASIQSVLDAFPARPVRVLRSPVLSPLATVLLAVLLLGIGGVFLWGEGPGLMKDWKISQAPLIIRDAEITGGRCTTRLVLVNCEAKLSYKVAGVSYRSEPSLMFLSFEGYDSARAVRSATDPALATLNIALDQLWNRTITLICLSALFAGFAVFALMLFPRARRWQRLVNERASVSVVPMIVEITNSTRNFKRNTYSFSYNDGGQKRRAQGALGKDRPFVVGFKGKHPLALALLAAHGDPLLLDEQLTVIEITDVERDALRAARDALA